MATAADKPSADGSITVTADHEILSFDPAIPPACAIDPGSTVSFQTSGQVLKQLAAGAPLASIDLERANAVAGPVLVRGACPGDGVRIEVLDIAIDQAWVVWMEGLGPLGSRTSGVRVFEVPISGGRIQLGEGLSVPLAPMIGCVGLAPADGTMSTMRPVYPTGGAEASPTAVWTRHRVRRDGSELSPRHAPRLCNKPSTSSRQHMECRRRTPTSTSAPASSCVPPDRLAPRSAGRRPPWRWSPIRPLSGDREHVCRDRSNLGRESCRAAGSGDGQTLGC